MSKLVFTESSDDAVWDFEDDATRWVDNCPDLTHAEEMEGAVLGYRAGGAASEARIKALEATVTKYTSELKRLDPYLDAIICYASTRAEHEPNDIAFCIRALLKEADPC